jgi:hypothetical protein
MEAPFSVVGFPGTASSEISVVRGNRSFTPEDTVETLAMHAWRHIGPGRRDRIRQLDTASLLLSSIEYASTVIVGRLITRSHL